jgi:hypothetical protein
MAEIDERYKRGKIYTIRCRFDDSLVYVGSTIQPLAKRIGGHRQDKKCSLYQFVDGDWSNWYIELYEEFPCDNKEQLEKKEGEVIREIATINKYIAGRDLKQYYQDNRDKILEKVKQYRQDNRDKILEQKKQYHQDNRDKRLEQQKQYHQDNRDKRLEQNKQYHQDNRDKILEYNKQYYQDNRDKILEKCKCDICGVEVLKYGIRRHQKTAKCMSANK